MSKFWCDDDERVEPRCVLQGYSDSLTFSSKYSSLEKNKVCKSVMHSRQKYNGFYSIQYNILADVITPSMSVVNCRQRFLPRLIAV